MPIFPQNGRTLRGPYEANELLGQWAVLRTDDQIKCFEQRVGAVSQVFDSRGRPIDRNRYQRAIFRQDGRERPSGQRPLGGLGAIQGCLIGVSDWNAPHPTDLGQGFGHAGDFRFEQQRI